MTPIFLCDSPPTERSHLRMGRPWRLSHLNFPNSWSDHNLPCPFIFPTHSLLFILFVARHETMTWVIGVHLEQGSANHSPGAKYGPAPTFVNRAVLEHSHAPVSHIVYGCFHATSLDLSCYNRDQMMWPAKPKRFTMLTWPRKSFPCSPGAMFLGQAHGSDYINPPPCHWENWIWHWRAAGRENEAEVRELAGKLCLFGARSQPG